MGQEDTFHCEQAGSIKHLQDQHDILLSKHEALMERIAEGDTLFELIKHDLDLIKAAQSENNKATQKIDKRLFIDNGVKSHQTKINDNETNIARILKAMESMQKYVAGLIVTVAGSLIVVGIIAVIKHF